MKCPHGDGWTGPFKAFGGHMAKKHRRIMLKNLKKAHTPAARAKAARTRQAKRISEAGGIRLPQTPHKGGKRRRTKQDVSGGILEGFPPPPPPDGYVIESVTYRRA